MPSRKLTAAVAALAAAGLVWVLLPASVKERFGIGGGPVAPAAKAPPAVAVKAARAHMTTFEDRVEAIGTLRANESVALTAAVTDIVSAIYFEDGQRVEKGQVLVEMVRTEEKALLQEATSSVEEAKSQYERAKDLASRKFASESVLDQRRREFETAGARLSAIEARIADRVVRAPFTGVVGLRIMSVGALVEPDTTIAVIEDDSVMKLDFSVPSTFMSTLEPGLSIVARARGYEGQVFRGRVASIDNRIDEVTRTVRVRALIPNEQRQLKSGLLMTVDLLKNARQALTVSESALVPAGSETYVFVTGAEGGPVERRRITTGIRRQGEVEVLDGLKDGELVVTDGTLKLRPGVTVKIQSVAEPGGGAPAVTPQAAGGRS